MRIDSVVVSTLEIPFREPLVSGTRRWERRRITLLSLRTDSGIEGLGEFVAPTPHDLVEDVTPQLASMLEGIDLGDPVSLERTIRRLDRHAFVGRVARAAVESAVMDLLARSAGRTVAASLGPDPAADVAVNGLIGMVGEEDAVAAAQEWMRRRVGTVKLKGGDEPPGALRARVAAVRTVVGPDVALRIDFNGELPARSAATVIAEVAPFDLEYVEQPISPTAGVAALARLRRTSAIPIAADESVRDLGSARALIDDYAVDAIVLKAARVGGLRQASSIAELATEAGIPVTVSTLFESGVGIAGALHLAATLPGKHAHGLATAELLETDVLVRHLEISAGRMALPTEPGLGVELDAAAIERYRVA